MYCWKIQLWEQQSKTLDLPHGNDFHLQNLLLFPCQECVLYWHGLPTPWVPLKLLSIFRFYFKSEEPNLFLWERKESVIDAKGETGIIYAAVLEPESTKQILLCLYFSFILPFPWNCFVPSNPGNKAAMQALGILFKKFLFEKGSELVPLKSSEDDSGAMPFIHKIHSHVYL